MEHLQVASFRHITHTGWMKEGKVEGGREITKTFLFPSLTGPPGRLRKGRYGFDMLPDPWWRPGGKAA
jgi:hypothetical protein